MAESNRVQVSYLRESTWGTTPASAFQAIPYVSGAMPNGQDTVRSQTIRSDAQLSDSKRVGLSPTAQYSVEFHASVRK